MQQHIRVEIASVAKDPVRAVTAIFKIGFVFGKPGRIKAVSAADEHNGKPVFRRHPDNALMSVDQPCLSGGKFCAEFPSAPHVHQFKIRSAKAAKHRHSLHTGLQRFTAQTLPRRIDQFNLAVFQRRLRIVLKISRVGFQSSTQPFFKMMFAYCFSSPVAMTA